MVICIVTIVHRSCQESREIPYHIINRSVNISGKLVSACTMISTKHKHKECYCNCRHNFGPVTILNFSTGLVTFCQRQDFDHTKYRKSRRPSVFWDLKLKTYAAINSVHIQYFILPLKLTVIIVIYIITWDLVKVDIPSVPPYNSRPVIWQVSQ